MKQFLKDLKKYVVIILLVAMIAVNSYGINQNTNHCNRNAKATILLASGVETLAITYTRFLQMYQKDKLATGDRDSGLLAFVAKNAEEIIQIRKDEIELMKNQQTLNDNMLAFHKAPTAQYLKDVTVFIEGQEYVIVVPPIVPKIPFTPPVPNIPKVTAEENPVGGWCGTGVVVKIDAEYTYIITNKHVAGGDRPAILDIVHMGKTYPAYVVAKHKTQDLALLKVKGLIPTKQVVKGLSYPVIAEKAYTIGHSLGRPYVYGEGVFSATDIEHDIYQLACMPGCSGSGVFNKNGELLGLVYSMTGANINNTVAWDVAHANVVKGVYVKDFIAEYLN